MGFVDREMGAVAEPKNRASFFEGHFWFRGDRPVFASENSSLLAFANPVL
jgi:hypothetical protein